MLAFAIEIYSLNSQAEFETNLAAKLVSDVFLEDVKPFISTDFDYDPSISADLVRKELIFKLPDEPWKGVVTE